VGGEGGGEREGQDSLGVKISQKEGRTEGGSQKEGRTEGGRK
jgi:hypothetical protein